MCRRTTLAPRTPLKAFWLGIGIVATLPTPALPGQVRTVGGTLTGSVSHPLSPVNPSSRVLEPKG